MNPFPSPDDYDDMCGLCKLTVNDNDRAICCDKCKKWIHIKCNRVTVKQYKHFQNNPNIEFTCRECNKCGICEKNVASNHHAIECDLCSKWIHLKCNKLNTNDYVYHKNNGDEKFFC